MEILDLADKLWRGEISIEDRHPFSLIGAAEEVADGVAFVPSFANVSAAWTTYPVRLVRARARWR